MEECDPTSSTERIRIVPLVQQIVPTPYKSPDAWKDTRQNFALSPHVSWTRTCPLRQVMNQLFLCHLDSSVKKLFRSNQGNFAHQYRPIQQLMSTVLTTIPTSMATIPNVFLQFVQAILVHYQKQRNKRVVSNQSVSTGSQRKYPPDYPKLNEYKEPPPVLQSVHSNGHMEKVTNEFLESEPVESDLVSFATSHSTSQLLSRHHYHVHKTRQCISCHHTGQSGDVISRKPPRFSNFIEEIENDLTPLEDDTNLSLLALQKWTPVLEEPDDSCRARKKGMKGKKRQIEQKRILGNLYSGNVETEDQCKSLKEAEKGYKRKSREERKRERKIRKQGRITLLKSQNAHFQVPLSCDKGHLEEASKVTPEHSNRSYISIHETENSRKRQAQTDKYFDPRIKNYHPKPIDSQSPVSTKLHNRYDQAATLTNPSRLGCELNPPVDVMTLQPFPQTRKSKNLLTTIIDSRLTVMNLSVKIPFNLSCTNAPPIPRSPPIHTRYLAPQVVYPLTSTADMTPLTADPPLKFLCSETFLGVWSVATSELSSGSWLSSLSNVGVGQGTLKSVSPVGRKFILHDTSLLDDMGVDIEIPGRGAVVVCALSSWRILDIRSLVRKYILTASVGKYKNLDFFLCVDVEMTPSLATNVALLQISMLCGGGNCIASFHTITPKTLSTALAYRLLKSGAYPLTFINESMNDTRVVQRVRFLLALVPCLTVTGALSLLRAAGQGDNNPLSEEGSKLGIQKLLGSKTFLANCRNEIKAGRSTTYLADMNTINQLAIASLVPLGRNAQ